MEKIQEDTFMKKIRGVPTNFSVYDDSMDGAREIIDEYMKNVRSYYALRQKLKLKSYNQLNKCSGLN